VAKVRSLTELCGLRVSVEAYIAPKGPLQCKRCQRFGHTQRYCSYAPRCVACCEAHPSGECGSSKQQLQCCCCRGNHTANYRGCVKWKEAKAALAKRTPLGNKEGRAPSTAAPKLAEEQEILGPGWTHVVCGGRVVKVTPTEPIPSTDPIIAPTPKVVVQSPNGKTDKSTPKVTVSPKQTPVTKVGKAAKTLQPQTKVADPNHSEQSPIDFLYSI
jgi:hypothetical protein